MRTIGNSAMVALLAAAALVLAGCGGPAAEGGTTVPATSSASSPSTGGATSTTQAPPSSIPAATPTATNTGGEPTVLPTTASVTVFYVAVGDGEVSGPKSGVEFGCGDTLVAATSPAISFTDPVEAALRTLLKTKDMDVGESGLHNALWQSDLTVKSVNRSGNPIIVDLEGTLKMGGECDIPRAQMQLLLTAQEAAGFPIEIMINGEPMAEALGLK